MKRSEARLKTSDDIKRIGEAGKIISQIFKDLSGFSFDNVSTQELDCYIENMIHRNKARPAFKTVRGYDHATCISINSEVVHGIPSKKKFIRSGDIVKIDIGVVLNGFFADSCKTFPVGQITEEAARLIDTAKRCLDRAIPFLNPDNRAGDIGEAIQVYAESRGYSVVRDYTGHGVGFSLHENPTIPHYGKMGTGIVIREGMVLALEPMINEGSFMVNTLSDGWTAVTSDGKLSAQFEHTVAVTSSGPMILT